MTIIGFFGLAAMTVLALTVGIGAGLLILEGVLNVLRTTVAVAAAEPAMATGNVVEFKQRSTGSLRADRGAFERAA